MGAVKRQAEIDSKTNAVRQRYNVGETSRARAREQPSDGKTLEKLKETISTGFQQATETGNYTQTLLGRERFFPGFSLEQWQTVV